MIRGRFAICGTLLAVLILALPALADNKNNKGKSGQEKKDDAKVKNEKQDLQQAQAQLKENQKDLQQAQQALTQAQAKVRDARRELDEARQKAEGQRGKSFGLDQATAEQKAAQDAFDAIKGPVLSALQASPEYQQAVQKVQGAQARLKELRGSSAGSETARSAGLAAAARDALAVSELEQQTLAANASAKSAKDRLGQAQEKVAAIRARLKEAVEGDPAVKSANGAMQSAANAVDRAEAKVASLRQKLAGDAAKVAREQQQVRQAEIQDKKNDGNSKKNPGKGGKK